MTILGVSENARGRASGNDEQLCEKPGGFGGPEGIDETLRIRDMHRGLPDEAEGDSRKESVNC
jgi:hypothetical protein